MVVAADFAGGAARLEHWLGCEDEDVHWVLRENLGKAPLHRLDPAWVERTSARVAP